MSRPTTCNTPYERHISKGRDDVDLCPVCNQAVAWHSKDGISTQVSVPTSPRLGNCVYLLITFISGAPYLLGTAWVVASQSGRLLLTAYHCLILAKDSLKSLFLLECISYNPDGAIWLDPSTPIAVEVVAADPVSDAAVLRAGIVFPQSIPLCPATQYPTSRNEDRVKAYHCPIQMLFDGKIDAMAPMATSYDTVKQVSVHHFLICNAYLQGSAGGVVVDVSGRAVGLICSGYVPGVLLPIPDPFGTQREEVFTCSSYYNGLYPYARCVKLSSVRNLEVILSSN